jgi:hypothetical protein
MIARGIAFAQLVRGRVVAEQAHEMRRDGVHRLRAQR